MLLLSKEEGSNTPAAAENQLFVSFLRLQLQQLCVDSHGMGQKWHLLSAGVRRFQEVVSRYPNCICNQMHIVLGKGSSIGLGLNLFGTQGIFQTLLSRTL
jgi:hypothetical protein